MRGAIERTQSLISKFTCTRIPILAIFHLDPDFDANVAKLFIVPQLTSTLIFNYKLSSIQLSYKIIILSYIIINNA